MYVIGDRYKGMEVYRLVKSVYPQAAYPYNHIGVAYLGFGQYEKALAENQEFYRRNPNGMGLGNLACVLINLSRLQEAEQLLAEGESRHLDPTSLLPFHYSLAFLRGDSQQMAKIVAEASADPGMQRQFFSIQADTAAYEGRLQQSRKFRQQAVEGCLNYSLRELAAAQTAAAAMQESDVGNFKAAQQLAAKSLQLARTRVVRRQRQLRTLNQATFVKRNHWQTNSAAAILPTLSRICCGFPTSKPSSPRSRATTPARLRH